MPTNDADAIRRALAILKNRGVPVTIETGAFAKGLRTFTGAAKFLISGVGVAYFYLFIVEEAVQNAGFGVFVTMQGKLWREAAAQNRRYREIAEVGLAATAVFSLDTKEGPSEDVISFTYQVLKLPLDFVQSVVKELTGTDSTVTEFIFLPYRLFFEAAIETSKAYDGRIAAELSGFNPAYKQKIDAVRKQFDEENFAAKQALDARLDAMRIEKAKEMDELSITISDLKADVARRLKEKEIVKEQADVLKLEITKIKNEQELAIRAKYDEKDRVLRKVHFDEMQLLERTQENREADLRQQFYPTDEEITIVQPTPTPTPTPTPIPPTQEAVQIFIISELENGTRIGGLIIRYDSKAVQTADDGTSLITLNKNQATEMRFKAPTGYIILPDGVAEVSLNITAQENYTTTFLLRKISEQPIIQPLPSDNNGIQGASASVEFGFLDPPRALGDGGFAANLIIRNQRELTVTELSNTSQEILSVRLNLTGPFTNTQPLDVDYKLLRPDGTVLVVPESAAEILGTPSSQGFQWWNWAKFAAVFNGIGGDLTGKGLYKLTILIDGGSPPSGFYELYFRVS